LVQLGCESLASKPFGVLSQGERQQVLIARARMARPLLLVLDEPCAGMDPGVRERFLGWLDERIKNDEARMTNDECEIRIPGIRQSSFDIRDSTPTTVLVTHHIEEIVSGIRNTLVLAGGRVYAAGRTPVVVTRETIETVYQTRIARIEQSGGRLWPVWQ
jgi:iron complex transport system ATP-binding protein